MRLEILPDFITESPYITHYPGDKISLFKTTTPTHLLKGHYRHLNYEFILTQTPVQGFALNGQVLNIEKNALFAINSNQKHGTDHLISEVSFISIQYEKTFLDVLALELHGIKELTFSNTPIALDDGLLQLVQTYILESDKKEMGYLLILNTLSIQIAIALFRRLMIPSEAVLKPQDKSAIYCVLAYFKTHYETEITLEQLSEHSELNKFTLIKKFKEATGMTPHNYLIHMRVMKSIEHLKNTGDKIIDIALQCGFENHSHFSKTFKAKTGLSPTQYRKNYLGQ